MWYCSNCGTKNESGEFCCSCGTKRVAGSAISGSGTRSDPYKFDNSGKGRKGSGFIRAIVWILFLFVAAVSAVYLIGMYQHNKASEPEEIRIEYDGETQDSIRLSLEKDDGAELVAVLVPLSADGDISWDSSDTDVVSIKEKGDCCRLRLKSEGNAVITASCGELSAELEITVASDIIMLPDPEM